MNLLVIICIAIIIVAIFSIVLIRIEKFNDDLNIDAVIYINLEKRDDRKSRILKELEKLQISKNKIHKISGVYIPKNGHKGCVQSHILALQMAKLNKWQRVLIVEDDAELAVDPTIGKRIIQECLDMADWNVFMLGTYYKKIRGVIKLLDNGFSVERLKKATSATAYIVKYDYIDTLMNVFYTSNDHMSPEKLSGNNFEPWALDQQWSNLQESDIWYCLNKDLFIQGNSPSTIMAESHT